MGEPVSLTTPWAIEWHSESWKDTSEASLGKMQSRRAIACRRPCLWWGWAGRVGVAGVGQGGSEASGIQTLLRHCQTPGYTIVGSMMSLPITLVQPGQCHGQAIRP